ncbi:MAG: HAMP domain-containing protein [Desulfopila sp.]|jgi:HAMP domain-containing protein|nr:HAMP domain-containing protein [Desulfopila sp.]
MKIRTKIFTILFSSSLSLLLLAGVVFYTSEKNTLKEQIYKQLQSVASLQHARLESIIEQNVERLRLVASRTQLRISLEKYLKNWDGGQHQDKMVRILNDAKASIESFHDIHILSAAGVPIASTAQGDFIGTLPIDAGLLERSRSHYSADTLYLDEGKNLRILLSGPLSLSGEFLGSIIIESEVESFISSVSNYTGLGRTGEIIVARRTEEGDAAFLFPTRFDPDAGLQRQVEKEKSNCPLAIGIARQSNTVSTGIDYRGQAVLTVCEYLETVDWTIFVKIDEDEAFYAIWQAQKLIATLTIGLIFLAGVSAYFLARNITRPIVYLTDITRQISRNGLQTSIEKTSSDEIGELAHSFREMIAKRQEVQAEHEKLVAQLQSALAEVKVLRGILPICCYCKNIRNDQGYFEQIESYLHKYSGVDFSHTVCLSCMEKYHPEEYEAFLKEKDNSAG